MKRCGKIAHLSCELQHQLNSYLDHGESAKALVQWLNSLPEMQSIVRNFFAGNPVSKQNLSEWTKGGFQEWRVRMGKVEGALNLDWEATELEAATDGRLADRLATALTGRYANLVHGWDGEVTEEFSKKLRVLQRMVQDSANLRRWDHDAVRVRLAKAAHESVQEQTNEALFEQFEQWAKKPKVRDYLLLQQQTHREQQQRERERWELLKTPMKPPEEPPPVSPLSDPAYIPQRHPAPPAAPAPESNLVQASPGQSNLSAGAGTASPHNATPADASPNHQSNPQIPDARLQTLTLGSNPVKPSQGQSNLSPGVATACRHNAPSPDLQSDHQPSSARQSVQNPAPRPSPRAPSPPSAVPSPCLGICQFNDGGFCKSCFRNTAEKIRWPTMAEVEKAFVVATCARRKANPHFGGGK